MATIKSTSTDFSEAEYYVTVIREYEDDTNNTDVHIAIGGRTGSDRAFGSFTQQDAYQIIRTLAEKARLPHALVDGLIEVKDPGPALTKEQKRKQEISMEIFDDSYVGLSSYEIKAVDRIYELESK
jgi:hypothetical protein